jgi:hypothetical protein
MDPEENLGLDMDVGASAVDLGYKEKKYGELTVRQVIKSGKPNGEYHIKSKSNVRPQIIVDFFKIKVPDYEVGLVDPDGVLGLEYPIYLILGTSLATNIAEHGFSIMDVEFQKHVNELKNKQS